MAYPRINLLGVPVDCLTPREARNAVEVMLETGRAHSIIAVNPEKVMQARRNPQLMEQLMRTSLLLPDGTGVAWLAKKMTRINMQRIAGADFMPEICRIAQRREANIFLFGGKEGIAERVSLHLQSRFPGIRIIGTQHGYVSESETDELIDRINEAKTDIVFLALGSPTQEYWMARNLSRLHIKLCQGVGGTFDVLAGVARRAPRLVQACHAEWLYRLLANPSRVIRQRALVEYALLAMKHHLLGVPV